MTRDEKRQFIADLCTAVSKHAMSKVAEMPEEWDGHELRQYLADEFSREISTLMRAKRSRRVRQYNNTIAVTNL